ncbi:hypothetical protein [Roseateles sp. BYS96W]|uniref:Uncharacterized protein n=1 Tax=Pelomonas nitida TaxID=3299027 RepID=A0ABW7GCZ1_9BURK
MIGRGNGAAGRDNSPYVAFKDDRERRRALVSRDVRLVLVVLILTAGGAGLGGRWTELLRLIGVG